MLYALKKTTGLVETLVFDVKNLDWNCKIHEHQPTERIPERVMLQYTSAVESGDSASEPSHLRAAESSSEGEEEMGPSPGCP